MSIRAFHSIRTKLVLSLGLPLLISYLALLAADFVIGRRVAVEQMQATVLERAEGAARVVDSRLASVAQISHAVTMMAAANPAERARSALEEALNNRWVTTATIVVAPADGPPTTYVARRENRFGGGPAGRGRVVIEPTTTPAWFDDARRATAGKWNVDGATGPAATRTARYVEPLAAGGRAAGAIALDVSLQSIRNLRPGRGFEGGPPGDERRDALATTRPGAEELADFALFDATGRLVMPAAAATDQASPLDRSLFEVADSVASPEMAATARRAIAGDAGIVSVAGLGKILTGLPDDSAHWLAMSPIASTGWFLVTAVAESQHVQPVVARLLQRAIFLATGLVVMVVVVLLISIRMSRRLERLDVAVGRLAKGELDAPMPPVDSRDEIGRLTRGVSTMSRDLRERIAALTAQTAAREKVEGELRIARQIQLDLLPKTFPPFPDRTEFELHAINEPALQVAGDFYDFFFTADGLMTIVVADVSGKGVPAALLMAVTRTLVRSLADVNNEPASIVRGVNTALSRDSATHMFVTMFVCRYDPASGRIGYVNAGHPPPLRLSPVAAPTPFCNVNSPVVGLDDSGVMGAFEQHEETLAPGETLLVYTDGVLDAPGEGADYLELSGLIEVLKDQGNATARAVCERLIDVLIHSRATPRRDDTTVLAIRRSPTVIARK